MWKRMIWVVVILLCGVSLAVAQDETPVVIDAGNINQLASVTQVDFSSTSKQVGEIENGWFALSRYSLRDKFQLIATVNQKGAITFWDDKGEFVDQYIVNSDIDGLPTNFLDGSFAPDDEYVFTSIHTDGQVFYNVFLSIYHSGIAYQTVEKFPFQRDRPVAVWARERPTGTMFLGFLVGFEILPFDAQEEPYVATVDTFSAGAYQYNGLGDLMGGKVALSPDSDPESVIRIGRIEPPLAVTVTEDGRVKRWNMETGEVTAEVQVDVDDGLPIYGALNAGGDSDLVWRDPASTALHILSFETGEDRTVVPLNGTYIPFIFLTQQSDVIIGVNIDDEPIVVAWNVVTGERYDLGAYRQCNRPPDMVRLSQDGTTLVIGCDTGLDVWRVGEPE